MVLDLYVLSLNSMFSHVNKEEMEVSIEHDFATLNAKLECSMKLQKTNGVTQEANWSCLAYTKSGEAWKINIKKG